MRKICLSLFLLVFWLNVWGQSKHFSLKWNIDQISDNQSIPPGSMAFFQSENFQYTPQNLYFTAVWNESLPVDETTVRLQNISYSPVQPSLVKTMSVKLSQERFVPRLNNSRARDQRLAVFQINALIYKNGTYYKLDSFDLSYQYKNWQKNPVVQNIYDSKWASGKWYRFKIDKTGVYKIDKNFLKDLGIDVGSVNPKKIKIFGNGGKVMPLRNDVFYPEDITELAIKVAGEQDGVFNDDDYILFYAVSDKEWTDDYDSNLNFYTDTTYYYIQIDESDGKRISDYIEPLDDATEFYDDYLSRQFYEQDKTIFTYMGRKAFDEPLTLSENSKELHFAFDHLVTSKPVRYTIKAAVNKAPVSLRVTVNNQTSFSLNFSYVCSYCLGTENSQSGTLTVSGDQVDFDLNFDTNNLFDAHLYLEYVNVWAYCRLQAGGHQFAFSNPDATGDGVGAYSFNQAKDIVQIWDVTDPYTPAVFENAQDNFNLKFDRTVRKKFVAVDKNDFYVPEKTEETAQSNQNLHREVFYHTGQLADLDYLIVTPAFLHEQAEKFAGLHRAKGLNVYVADLQKIYNEFGNGQTDIAAIRNFIKYIYNNASTPDKRLKFVMMFGDASNNYKNLIPDYLLTGGTSSNIVPIYESLQSFSLVSSIASDDFFVMMDPDEGQLIDMSENPDIAVGRLVVRDEKEAGVLYEKYLNYQRPEAFQNWRTYITLWADDADPDNTWEIQFTENTEEIAQKISDIHPEFNLVKIYQDAYKQVNTPGGPRYPDAKRDLINQFEKGSLIVAYIGHGNEIALSHERMLVIDDILNMHNANRLPLMSTMTCEFGKFDNPTTETAAEILMWHQDGGVLEMVSTTRSMYSINANNMHIDFYETLLGLGAGMNGEIIKNPAEALQLTKNYTHSGTGKFNVAFLGDPGFDLGFARPKIVLKTINNQPVDTLKALKHIVIKGEVQDENSNLMSGFNGTLSSVVFDKYQQAQTLDNDYNGLNVSFEKLGPKLFQGKTDVINGTFQFEFIVPKDINLSYGKGRISFYAANQNDEKIGYNQDIIVGGVDENAEDDNTPPVIKAYMNDTSFVSGGITDSSPYIILELKDEHGINTIGGIGHDITAYIDDNQENVFVLNDFYETENNTYKEGKVKYRLYDLEPGWHTLTAKAWDVYNNSATTTIDFQVVSNEELKIEKVLNYPNPFIDYTEFWFNHNHPFETLDVMIQVYTVSGKLVWQHRQSVVTEGYLSREITWDGRDNYGNKLAKGVYVYRLSVRTLNGKTAQKIEKLVIL